MVSYLATHGIVVCSAICQILNVEQSGWVERKEYRQYMCLLDST